MKLKFVFWAFAAIQFLTLLAMMFSPREIAESFGIEYSESMSVIFQFAMLTQLMLIIITSQIPSWLGKRLGKAALTYAAIALLPVCQNVYHIASDILPITGAFYIENSLWIIFSVAFYLFGKRESEDVKEDI